MVGPGQSSLVQNITGAIPAPEINPGSSCSVGWGAYAQLQEQPPNTTNWFTVDSVLILFGNWPQLNGIIGPGGGVVRLDPDWVGLTADNPLVQVVILGPLTVPEGSSTPYIGSATYTLGQTYSFSNTAWSASRFTITSNGVFTAGSVLSNTPVTLTAPYTNEGYLLTTMTNVTVLPLMFTALNALTNTGVAVTLTNGIPGGSNVIQATTNLACTNCWVTLLTNLFPSNGVLNTNLPWTNSRGFFRAREFP